MRTPDEIKKGLECCIGDDEDVCCDECVYCGEIRCVRKLTDDALAYIQRLEAQNDTIMQSFQRLKKVCVAQGATIRRLEAERDAAIRDLTEWGQNTDDSCDYCLHDKEGTCSPKCRMKNEGFEWRGVQKEE